MQAHIPSTVLYIHPNIFDLFITYEIQWLYYMETLNNTQLYFKTDKNL